MIRAFLSIFLLLSSLVVSGQIDAVEPDTLLDKFYINLPVEQGREEYLVGDTVVAVYDAPDTRWDKNYGLVFHNYPKGQSKPVYIVRAIVTDVAKFSKEDPYLLKGLKLKIYSIEQHCNGKVLFLKNVTTSENCVLRVGQEQWRDIDDWQNISGLYKIQKSTDNYRVGDTVNRLYRLDRSVFRKLFGNRASWVYTIRAVVKDIDSDKQRILLEFKDIKLDYDRYRIIAEKHEHISIAADSMEYNGELVHRNDLVWTKPYMWLKSINGSVSTGAQAIFSSITNFRWCEALRISIYDCYGNEYSLNTSKDE